MCRCETTRRGPAGCGDDAVQPEVVAQPLVRQPQPAQVGRGQRVLGDERRAHAEPLLAGVEFLAALAGHGHLDPAARGVVQENLVLHAAERDEPVFQPAVDQPSVSSRPAEELSGLSGELVLLCRLRQRPTRLGVRFFGGDLRLQRADAPLVFRVVVVLRRAMRVLLATE